MIGTVAELRIEQVVSLTEAIVDWTWYTVMPYGNSVRPVPHPCSLWMRGVDTTAAADGSIISPPQVFQVTGTKTYRTAIGGTKTLFVIEPIDVRQYLKNKPSRTETAEESRAPFFAVDQPRKRSPQKEDEEGTKLGKDKAPLAAAKGREVFAGHTYQVVDAYVTTYEAALQAGGATGGHLVTITSQEEQDFVVSLVRKHNPRGNVWIGLQRTAENKLAWVTGEPVVFSRWQSAREGQPGKCVMLTPSFAGQDNPAVGKWVLRNEQTDGDFGKPAWRSGLVLEWDITAQQ